MRKLVFLLSLLLGCSGNKTDDHLFNDSDTVGDLDTVGDRDTGDTEGETDSSTELDSAPDTGEDTDSSLAEDTDSASDNIYDLSLPGENSVEWSPGVPGGIVDNTSTEIDVCDDFGADKTGTNDSRDAFQNAINSLTDGGVINIPAGEYSIEGSLQIENSNIILRGAGRDKTKLYFNNPDLNACIETLTYQRGDWQTFTGFTKGLTEVTVQDGSKFTVGKFAEIQQENDADVMYTQTEWNQSWAADAVGQFFEVEAVNGNKITLKTPLHITFNNDLNPVIRPQGFLTGIGIENMYIEMISDSDVHIIYFKNTAYSWIKNVESYHSAKAHAASESTLGCTVRDSFFHRSHNYGGGGHGYGIALGLHTTDWLIENCTFESLRHAMLVHLGANGNVFAYNFSKTILQGEGETNLNDGWEPPDISIHGHYAFMNLFESNSVNEIGISDYWGPAGPGNTFFRNFVKNSESPDGISYYDHTSHQNIIGNSTKIIRDNDGDASFNFEHGNVVDETLIWDSATDNHSLPASFYLKKRPDFLELSNWPLFGPQEGFENRLPSDIF